MFALLLFFLNSWGEEHFPFLFLSLCSFLFSFSEDAAGAHWCLFLKYGPRLKMGHGSLLVALCKTAWTSLGYRARVILFRLDLKFTNVTLTRIIY